MSDIGDWYRTIPEITKYWFTGSVILPLLGRFGLFNPYYMVLEWNLLVYRFQVILISLFIIIYSRYGVHLRLYSIFQSHRKQDFIGCSCCTFCTITRVVPKLVCRICIYLQLETYFRCIRWSTGRLSVHAHLQLDCLLCKCVAVCIHRDR